MLRRRPFDRLRDLFFANRPFDGLRDLFFASRPFDASTKHSDRRLRDLSLTYFMDCPLTLGFK